MTAKMHGVMLNLRTSLGTNKIPTASEIAPELVTSAAESETISNQSRLPKKDGGANMKSNREQRRNKKLQEAELRMDIHKYPICFEESSDSEDDDILQNLSGEDKKPSQVYV